MLFDPSVHSDLRQSDSADTLRVGGRRRLDNGDTLLGTMMYQQDERLLDVRPVLDRSRAVYMHGADIQHIHAAPRWNVRSGILSMRQSGVGRLLRSPAAGPNQS